MNVCQFCHKEFNALPHSKGMYCSRECSYKGRKDKSRQWFSCEVCGSQFWRHNSEVKKSESRGAKTRFCSLGCRDKEIGKNNIQRICKFCGVGFTVWESSKRHAEKMGLNWGVYCSAKCRDSQGAIERFRQVSVNCGTCGKEFFTIPAKIKNSKHGIMYCSQKCLGAAVHSWNRHGRGRSGVRPDLGHFVRSSWEANVCRIFNAMGVGYEFEPRTFDCGDCFYTPDLYIPEWNTWIEVKGWMRESGMKKIDAFRSAYPEERLVIIDKPLYRAMRSEWRHSLFNWEE